MDLEALHADALAANFAVMGVGAIITRPGLAPITASVIWLSPTTADYPNGFELRRAAAKYLVAIRTLDVPHVVKDTLIEAQGPPGSGTTVRQWIVDAIDHVSTDMLRVIVRAIS